MALTKNPKKRPTAEKLLQVLPLPQTMSYFQKNKMSFNQVSNKCSVLYYFMFIASVCHTTFDTVFGN